MTGKIRKRWNHAIDRLARSSSPPAKMAFFIYALFASPVLRGAMILLCLILWFFYSLFTSDFCKQYRICNAFPATAKYLFEKVPPKAGGYE